MNIVTPSYIQCIVIVVVVVVYRVIESIINEQVDKLAVTLKDIHDLTSVARTAANRLSKLQEDNKENVIIIIIIIIIIIMMIIIIIILLFHTLMYM